MKDPLVLAITGASGVVYATRLLEILIKSGRDVHLTISPAGRLVLEQELGVNVNLEHFQPGALLDEAGDRVWNTDIELPRTLAAEASGKNDSAPFHFGEQGRLRYHHYQDYMAPIASGTFRTGGMVVCPCSGAALSAIVHGGSGNLLQRAADVHLKEQRKLILVPRETPLSMVHTENMTRACRMGAVVLPAMPGWYHGVKSLGDLVDFVVARVLDQLGIDHALIRSWGQGDADV